MIESHATTPLPQIAGSELILGGQKSGKSRRAEQLACDWLAAGSGRKALLIATASAGDAEMQQRIARHKADRAVRCPAMQLMEEPLTVAPALREYSRPDTLVVVDCLTLWLTHLSWPAYGPDGSQRAPLPPGLWRTELDGLVQAISAAPGPVVLVGNEIGMGVIPMGPQVRTFVDQLGQVNQAVAAACSRVTLMVAGLPLRLKDQA